MLFICLMVSSGLFITRSKYEEKKIKFPGRRGAWHSSRYAVEKIRESRRNVPEPGVIEFSTLDTCSKKK